MDTATVEQLINYIRLTGFIFFMLYHAVKLFLLRGSKSRFQKRWQCELDIRFTLNNKTTKLEDDGN